MEAYLGNKIRTCAHTTSHVHTKTKSGYAAAFSSRTSGATSSSSTTSALQTSALRQSPPPTPPRRRQPRPPPRPPPTPLSQRSRFKAKRRAELDRLPTSLRRRPRSESHVQRLTASVQATPARRLALHQPRQVPLSRLHLLRSSHPSKSSVRRTSNATQWRSNVFS